MFFRIDGVGDGEFGDLSGPRFLALAARTTAYQGAMAARLAEQTQERTDVRPDLLTTRAEPAREVDGSRAALAADPVTAGLIDF